MLIRRKHHPGVAYRFKEVSPCCGKQVEFWTRTRTSAMDARWSCYGCGKAWAFDILYIPDDNYFTQFRPQETPHEDPQVPSDRSDA
jgi:hypothetical protein